LTIYSTTIDTNDSPSEEMKKPEEYAAATVAAYKEELVAADTLAANDEGYVAAASFATYTEEFHTDKTIVKGHTNVKFDKINGEGDLPCPMLQDGCNKDEFKLFTLQWRLSIRERGELDYSEVRQHLLSCIDETLVDAIHDALGYKINTSSVTDMMKELGKLAVDEPFTVEEIVAVVENMCMIQEEKLIKQPDTRRNQPYNSLSRQTLPRFKDPALTHMLAQEDPALAQKLTQEDPALTQKLTQEDPALTQKLTQEDPALAQMLAQEDQLGHAADGNTKKVSLHTTPTRTQNQLLPAESQFPKNEVEVLDSTSDLQMTNTSTQLFGGRGAPTLQGGQHDHHRRDGGKGYVRPLREPDPTLQLAHDPMNNAAKDDVDVNDNPLGEINAEKKSTVEKTEGKGTNTKLGGGLGKDRTALVTIQDEIVKLRAKMTMLETSRSNLLTRFLEMNTKPLPVRTTEPSDTVVTNDSTLTEMTTIEPRAKTDHEASNMAKTGTDQPEIIREIFETQNMKQTKAPIMMPKN
jgi:hypothetical protein